MATTLLQIVIVFLWIGTLLTASSATRVHMSAPLNPVEEGGVFSVHCRVWELDHTHEVSILRRVSGTPQRLSLNGGLVHNIEDRFFIATRQLDDASDVYFLSIMNTKREDTGVYLCKVSEPGGGTLVEGSVELAVEYFPQDPDPSCNPPATSITVPCGQSLTLNCTSDTGNPPISMKWYRMHSGTELRLPETQVQHGGTIFSELTFNPRTLDDNQALFICKITSKGFPSKPPKTCHVGPISVVWSDHYPCNIPLLTTASHTTSEPDTYSRSPSDLSTDCLNTCSYFSKPVSHWIFATVVVAVLALIFFIVVISLIVKLYAERSKSSTYMPPQSQHHAELYAEVENRRLDNRIYMALEKRDPATCFDGHDYVGTNNRRL